MTKVLKEGIGHTESSHSFPALNSLSKNWMRKESKILSPYKKYRRPQIRRGFPSISSLISGREVEGV
jgi:hypothetical protein